MRVQLAVFDMVGTTVKAGDEVPSAFRDAFRGVGMELSDKDLTRIRGRSKRDAILDLLVIDGAAASERSELARRIYDRFQDSLRKAYQSRAEAVPGAASCFEALRGVGIQIVLTTGLGREIAELVVESLGWEDLGIQGLITGDDVTRGRPAPDLIHAAMRHAGVDDPKAVLSVGDTESDLDAAAAAGVGWSVGVLTGAHSRFQLESHAHSVILESIGELPEWLAVVGALE